MINDEMDEAQRETDRMAFSCDECEGFFTQGVPNIMDDGEFLCDDCLDDLISRHAPDCE